MFRFSKIHQYDHRKDFKEAWLGWLDENETFVDIETRRLINVGYEGDVKDKMFKSARYYFRKKSTVKKEPIQRRSYIATRKEFIDAIDAHIKTMTKSVIKPSDGYDDFCQNNKEIMNEEVEFLRINGFTDSTDIKNKFKKTYKNRHFLIVNK